MAALRRIVLASAAAVALLAHTLAHTIAHPAAAQDPSRVLRAVISGELRSIDPVWTTAVQTRYHSFMVYDTLFGLDAEQRIQPQMVESWTESPDHLTWTFTLRPSLVFSDGAPVTAEDVVVSWNRWAERGSVRSRAQQYSRCSLTRSDVPLCSFQEAEHGHGPAEEEHSAVVGWDVLVVAGSEAEEVAQLVVASTEPGG